MRYSLPVLTLGARIRAARQAVGMTQAQLGELVGVTNAAVSRWESDIDQPQLSLLPGLRNVLRVSLDTLVCGADLVQYVIEPNDGGAMRSSKLAMLPRIRDAAPNVLSPKEQILVEMLRQVSDEKRDAVIELLKPGK